MEQHVLMNASVNDDHRLKKNLVRSQRKIDGKREGESQCILLEELCSFCDGMNYSASYSEIARIGRSHRYPFACINVLVDISSPF